MQRSLSMERNAIPLCCTMFSIWLLYTIIDRIKYDVKDIKYIKLCIKNYFRNSRVAASWVVFAVCLELGACIT